MRTGKGLKIQVLKFLSLKSKSFYHGVPQSYTEVITKVLTGLFKHLPIGKHN